MVSINLAVTIDLDTEVSEQALSALSNELVKELSWTSSELISKVMLNPAVASDTNASVQVKRFDEAEIAKKGATKTLEELAVSLEASAEAYGKSALVDGDSSGTTPAYREDKHIAVGISTGLRGAASYARDAITRL